MIKKHSTLQKNKLLKAQKAIEKGKLKEAHEQLLKLCNKAPDNISALLLLASVYGRMNDYRAVAKCCHKILTLDTDNTTALNYLGNVYTALQQHDQAIDYYTLALKQDPKNFSVLNNLSALLYSQKRFDEAINILLRILKQKPNHAEAIGNLANIFTDKGLFNEALKYYKKLNTIYPQSADILLKLGKCYYNCGNTNKAKEILTSTLKHATDKRETIYIALADTALHDNNLDEAEDYLRKTLDSSPENIKALAGQANIWYRQGKFEKAQKHIKALINSNLISSNIINTYSEFCHRFNDCEYVIEQGEKLLEKEKMTQHQRVSLHFNLGRILDKSDQYSRAFEHYKKGNELMPVDYHPSKQTDFFEKIIQTYNTKEALPLSSIKTSRPIFIVGMPRSGTSLAEQILSSHKQIEGAGELVNIRDIAGDMLPELFKSNTPISLDITHKTNNKNLNQAAQNYLNVINNFSTDALRISDKMPQNFIYLGVIKQLFPEAIIIHCNRNPLDTILSIYFQYFSMSHNYSFNLDNIAHYYTQYQKLMKHWESILDIPVFNLNYEDLVYNFEGTCKRLVDFTGLKWDENCMNFYKSKRTIVTASFDQVRSPIYKSSLNRWRHYEEYVIPLKAKYPDFFTE